MTTSPPPILSSPDGWRQPRVLLPAAPRRLLVVGLVLSVIVAWNTIGFIAYAWEACDHVSPGAKFGLGFGLFPATAAGMWVTFYIGLVITRTRPALVRLFAGAALAIAAVFFLVTVLVPDPAFADYSGVGNREDRPECGPNGIPTWWPSWLPS